MIYVISGREGTALIEPKIVNNKKDATSYVLQQIADAVRYYVSYAYNDYDEYDRESLKEFRKLKTDEDVVNWGIETDIVSSDGLAFIANSDWLEFRVDEIEEKERIGEYASEILAEHDKEIMNKHFEKIMGFVNSSNRGNSDYFIVDQIENYIKENMKEKDELTEDDDREM